MIEVRPAEPKAPEFKGYKKGTLIQGYHGRADGSRNIYIVLEDSPDTGDIYCLRLVSNDGSDERALEVCHHISHSLVSPFNGELVIKNG